MSWGTTQESGPAGSRRPELRLRLPTVLASLFVLNFNGTQSFSLWSVPGDEPGTRAGGGGGEVEDEGQFPTARAGCRSVHLSGCTLGAEVAIWPRHLSPKPPPFSAQTETHSPGVEVPHMGGPRSSFSPAS